MKYFHTPESVELAVKNGETVYWMNKGYRVIFDGLQFLIGWNIGGRNENYVGLHWPSYKVSEFFAE